MVSGYKKTEIGVVPSEWDVLSFGEVFRTLSNNTLSRDQLNYDSGSIKDIHYGDVLILFPEVLDCSRDDIPYVNSNSSVSGQPLQDGDVIISDTAEDETVGKAVEIANQENTNIVAGLHTIPCRVKNSKFASGWLGYFINSHYYHDQLLPYIHGTKVSSIARESLADTYIAVPPYGEQEKIVNALTDIGRLISESEKLIEKYQAMKQGCLQHMFPHKGQTEPDMRLPGFAGAWEQRKLSNVANVYDGVHQTPDYQESGVMFLSVENITTLTSNKFISEEAFEKDYKNYPENGDILMTRIGDVGTPNVVETVEKVAFYVSLALLKPKNVDSYFLCNAIRSPEFQKGLRDRTLVTAIPKKINKDEIGKVEFLMPKNTDEQRAIGLYFKELDHLITFHQRKCEKYKMIKQGMMEDLLTGKVRLK